MDEVLYFGGGCIPVLPELPCTATKAAVSLLESSVVLGSSAPARLVQGKHSCFRKWSCPGESRNFPASYASVQLLSAHWGHQ